MGRNQEQALFFLSLFLELTGSWWWCVLRLWRTFSTRAFPAPQVSPAGPMACSDVDHMTRYPPQLSEGDASEWLMFWSSDQVSQDGPSGRRGNRTSV